jgi:topoisomerase IV subunit B
MLEGLEPVRRRPGMYIGGTDQEALHHLFDEVINNAIDEAVAGHADLIEVEYHADDYLSVTDNGRGIPIDPDPKFENRSALEIIMTTLYAGGKFSSKVYESSSGLHGVGVSVVNAFSEHFIVEVVRGQLLYRQEYRRGLPQGKLKELGKVSDRRGTTVKFIPDEHIFGKDNTRFSPALLYSMAQSKANQFAVEIRWRCAKEHLKETDIPEEAVLPFSGQPNWLQQILSRKELE